MSAEVALEAVLSIISDALVSGDKVQLVGFGTFESKERAARVGRNPRAYSGEYPCQACSGV